MPALKVHQVIANFINYNAFNTGPERGNTPRSAGEITLNYRFTRLSSYKLAICKYYMGRFIVYNHTATNPHYLSFVSQTTSRHINAVINQLQTAGIPYIVEGRSTYNDLVNFRFNMLDVRADIIRHAQIKEGRRVILEHNILQDDIYKYVIAPYI